LLCKNEITAKALHTLKIIVSGLFSNFFLLKNDSGKILKFYNKMHNLALFSCHVDAPLVPVLVSLKMNKKIKKITSFPTVYLGGGGGGSGKIYGMYSMRATQSHLYLNVQLF
jgi:hypothetical protein